MKKITSLCILSLCFITACTRQPGYLIYPSYKTIYNEFFKKYSVKGLQDISQLQFQKKPDGWHVVVLKYNTVDTILKDELFWSRSRKALQELKFPDASHSSENKEYLDKFWREPKTGSFNLFPYYNYKGWDWDVIQDYQGLSNLPDSTLYALGRSYSYFADNLLNDNSGFSDKRFMFKLKEEPDCLTPEQLEKYRKYHELSIETYKKVQKLNPKYETMVGDIGLKIADEYMVGYLDMMVYQNETEANKELKDNIYDYFMISFAKNYLTSCDSNAILITYGDNDTYPLLYVQAKYKFRTDVLVVNSSLLQTSRYINRMRMPFANAGALPLSMKREQYQDGTRDYIVFNAENANHPNNDNGYYDLKDIMDFISSDDPSKKIEVSGSDMVNYSPSKLFKLNVNYRNVFKSKILSESESNDIASEIKWKFPDPYMLKDKMMLLDAMVTNDWKRPICFCVGGGENEFAGLDNYLRMQGFVYEFVPLQNQSASLYSYAAISTSDEYNTVMHKLHWGNMGSGLALSKGKTYLAEMSRVMVGTLAQALVSEGKKDSAINILNLCEDSIPEKALPYENDEIVICEAYYAAGAFDKAYPISVKLFKLYEGNVVKYSKPNPDDPYRESSLRDAQLIIEKLTYDAKSYHQDALYKDYRKRLQVFFDNGMIDKQEFPDDDSK